MFKPKVKELIVHNLGNPILSIKTIAINQVQVLMLDLTLKPKENTQNQDKLTFLLLNSHQTHLKVMFLMVIHLPIMFTHLLSLEFLILLHSNTKNLLILQAHTSVDRYSIHFQMEIDLVEQQQVIVFKAVAYMILQSNLYSIEANLRVQDSMGEVHCFVGQIHLHRDRT